MRISTNELVIVLAIVLLIFGPRQIPRLIKMCKRGVESVRGKMGDDEDEDDEEAKPAAPEAPASAPAAQPAEESGKKKSLFGRKKED
jgi:sec-independent protein translocase protein TatA